MASLQPVYQQVRLLSDEEIDLHDVTTSETKENESCSRKTQCCAKSDKSCCKNDECSTCPQDRSSTATEKKCCRKKHSYGRRLCACVCGFLVFGLLLWVTSSVALVSYLGVKTYRCLHPSYSDTVKFVFDDNEVHEFDIGVVSGVINIRTCPKIEKTTVFVTRKAASSELLETMPIERHLNNGRFALIVQMPSFDFQHCQHATVDLVIPERLADSARYTIRAQTILGKVNVHAPRMTFRNVKIFSKVGLISTSHVKVDGKLEAEAEVGVIRARHVQATGAALRSYVGWVSARNVESDQVDVNVNVGRAKLFNFEAPEVSLTSDVGYLTAVGFNDLKTLDARVQYGKLNFVTEPGFMGDFSLRSPFGFIRVGHDKKVEKPHFVQNRPYHVSGSFGVHDNHNDDVNKVRMRGAYAAFSLYVPKDKDKHKQAP